VALFILCRYFNGGLRILPQEASTDQRRLYVLLVKSAVPQGVLVEEEARHVLRDDDGRVQSECEKLI
jgi:hypothetical protein